MVASTGERVRAAALTLFAERGYHGTGIRQLADAAGLEGVHVIHAGTAVSGEDVVTAGGRVLAVVGRGADLAQARERAYAGVERIRFDGAQWRTDIGLKAERGEITVPGTEGAK